jgi:hypothetical protein
MRDALRRNATTIAIAVTASALTAAAPSIAAGVRASFASNADKVDGIHATTAAKAKASAAARRGVLVATDPKTGTLPGAIIPSLPGSKVAVASLPTVPSATDATRLGGYTPAQLTQTKVDAIPDGATLDGEPTATVSFTAPAAGYVTWTAACEFRGLVGAATQVNLRTNADVGGDGIDTSRSHRTNITTDPQQIATLGVADWARVEAGQRIDVGVTALAASNGALITCHGGRLVATYSATTTEG